MAEIIIILINIYIIGSILVGCTWDFINWLKGKKLDKSNGYWSGAQE